MNRTIINPVKTTVQSVYREELIDSLCEQAQATIVDSFPNQTRLWNQLGVLPRVSCGYEQANRRLIVEYSMIFRTTSETIYKPLTKNRIFCDGIDRIQLDQLQSIFSVWTAAFISNVGVAIQASRSVH